MNVPQVTRFWALAGALLLTFWGLSTSAQPIQLVRSQKTTIGLASGINILVGQVTVRQGTATISCDSLWWDTRSQRFTAHGQVVYRKGKGQTVRSRNLTYDQVVAYFTGNVRAEQDRVLIQTESLSVLVADGTARWTQGAKIQLTDGSLTCRTGVLNGKSGVHRFEKSVVLLQKDAELRSDWVEYDDRSQWAWIRSAGELKRDSTHLTFAAGRWNSAQEEGLFWGPAVARQPHSTVSGDTLVIRQEGWSSRGRAHLFSWQRNDSLALRANRLDALDQQWLAGPRAQFWTPDFQASADSMVYHHQDSTLLFLRQSKPPVAFSGAYQIQSDTLYMVWRSGRSDSLYMGGNPLISGWNDSNQVDQMAGKRAHGFFTSSGLEQVILRRNAQARYHTWDNSKYLGINSITGPVLILDFKESALDRVRVNGSTSGVLEPSNPEDPAQPLPGYLDRRAEQLSRTDAISGRK